jgi:hypothetical protein
MAVDFARLPELLRIIVQQIPRPDGSHPARVPPRHSAEAGAIMINSFATSGCA